MNRVEIIETGEIFPSVLECARVIGGDDSTIYKVINGERNTHCGLHFRFVGPEEDFSDIPGITGNMLRYLQDLDNL